MKKNNNGYMLLPSKPTGSEVMQVVELEDFPKDVFILIAKFLRGVGLDKDVRHLSMTCKRLYALREEFMFHQILQPLRIKSLNADPLGRGLYARGKGVLHSIGIFPNGNILGANRSQLFVWSAEVLALLYRAVPRRSHQFMHAAILPDNSIAVISHKQAGCCTKEKFCVDVYNPVDYRRQRAYALVLKYPHSDEELKKQYILQIDLKGIQLRISWRRDNEMRQVENVVEFPECLKIWLEYQHNGMQKVFEINGESEVTSISFPNAVRECAEWPVANFPVRTHIQLSNTCLLGYHAVEDNTPVRNRAQRNMHSNCLIMWNSREYLNQRFHQVISEPVTLNNNNNAPTPK